MERIDFWDSIKLLAEQTGVDITAYQKDPEQQKAKASAKEKLKLLNKRTQWLFRQYFDGSDAQTYALEKRWLSAETIELFGLGYAPDDYDLMMQFLRQKWFSDTDLIDAGLAKQGKKHDAYAFFRHRLTFPIHDHIWNIVWFGARALSPDQTPKYLNITETAVYQKSKILYGLDKAKTHLKEVWALVIVEWYMDVIALAQHGLPVGIATCGTALTTDHTKLIKRQTDHLVFAFDHDSAWFEATVRGLKVAYEQDLFPKVLIFPNEFKDVDEWLQTHPHDTSPQTPLLGGEGLPTRDGFDWVMEEYQERMDLTNPVETKKVMHSLFEMMSKIEDYAVMQVYFTKVVWFFWLSEQLLRKQFRAWLKKSTVRSRRGYTEEGSQEDEKNTSSSKIQEKYLLGALIQNQNSLESEALKGYMDILKLLATYFPTSVVGEVMSGELSPETKEQLAWAQMWREMQLHDLDQSKSSEVIKKFLHQQVYKLQRVVVKSKTLEPREKDEVLKLVRWL